MYFFAHMKTKTRRIFSCWYFFLAELLLCYLTGNIFGVEISCGRHADDVRTTRERDMYVYVYFRYPVPQTARTIRAVDSTLSILIVKDLYVMCIL